METRRLNHQSRAEAKYQAQEKIALSLLPTPSLQTASIRGKILLESISLVFHPHFHLLRKCSKPLASTHARARAHTHTHTHKHIYRCVSVERVSAL
jgi:hypothetical protein